MPQTTTESSPVPGAGWFPDPSGQPQYRWFDGSSWTDRVTSGDGVTSERASTHSTPPGSRTGTAQKVILIVIAVVIAGIVAFLALGVLLFVIRGGPTADPSVDASVDGATIVDATTAANGTTTWIVVVDDDLDGEALEDIATALVSTPAAQAEDRLDVLFFDDHGRRLDDFIELTEELDELANQDEPDLERILEIGEDFPVGWIADHSVGSLTADRSETSTSPTYQLCTNEIAVGCVGDDTVTIQPDS